MSTPRTIAIGLATLLAGINLNLSPAFAQGTAFTYQGRLDVGGSPANGKYDLFFLLFEDSVPGDASLGLPVSYNAIGVTNGLFTVSLDFGNQYSPPYPYLWLEISVRTNGSGGYTTLNPRQRISPTPRAVHATSAGTAATADSVAAANVSGMMTLEQLPAGLLTNNASGVSLVGTFTGDGAGLTNLNTAQLTGIVADAQLSSNVALRAGGNNLTGNQTVTSGNVGIGTTSPTAALDVVGGTRVRALNPSWAAVTEYNDYANSTFRGFVGIDGIGLTGNANQLYAGTYTAHPVRIYTANTERMMISANGNVGIGTPTPSRLLEVGGPPGTEGLIRLQSRSTNGAALRIWDVGVPKDDVSTVGKFYSFVIDDAQLGTDPEFLIQYGTGNVGIGTTNPLAKLDVVGNVRATSFAGNLTGSVTGNGAGLTNLNASQLSSGAVADARLSSNVALRSGGNTFTGNQLVTSGSLGIGTNNPQSELDVVGDAQNMLVRSTTAGMSAYLEFNNSSALRGLIGADGGGFSGDPNQFSIATWTSHPIKFFTAGAERMAISANGNVGIGNSAPGRSLQIGGSPGTEGMIRLQSTSTNPGTFRTWDIGVPQNNTNVSGKFYSFVIDDVLLGTEPEFLIQYFTGNVGIGTTNPLAKLDVNGNIRATSIDASGSNLTALNASQLTSGTVSLARLPAAVVTNTATGVTLSGTFNGNGAGLTNLNATQLSSGLIADALLSTNVAMRTGSNIFQGNQYLPGGRIVMGSGNNVIGRINIKGDGRMLMIQSTTNTGPDVGAVAEFMDATGNVDGVIGPDGLNIFGGTNRFVVGTWSSNAMVFGTASSIRMTIDAAGRVGIGNTNPTNLLMVANARCDGSSWINASDRNLKQDFAAVDPQAVLDKVASLPIQSWSYKAQPDQKHVGPVAQDFRAAFGLGQDDTSIATVDADGVALAAIQGLNQKVAQENAALRSENAEFRARLEKLEKLLAPRLNGGAK